jgi:hypothetical protein
MKDLIRELEAERDAVLAAWKPPAPSDAFPDRSQPNGPSAAEDNWLYRVRSWLSSRRPRPWK